MSAAVPRANASVGRRVAAAAAAIATLGTSSLLRCGTLWLTRNGLARYVLPALLANECFGAWRVYAAGSAAGWW